MKRLPARGHDDALEQDDASLETGLDQAASIGVHLDALLELRGMTLTQLSERVGVTIVNLSILKNGRARAVRFSTLARLCQALDCQPGDLLVYEHTSALPADPA